MDIKVRGIRKVVYSAPAGEYEGTWFRNTVRFETSLGFYEVIVDKTVNGSVRCKVHVSDDIIINFGSQVPPKTDVSVTIEKED